MAAFFVMCFLLLMALFGPSLAPYAPEAYDYDNILAGPSASHLFGTDQYGRDIFSRILAGTPLTLGVSLSSVIVGAALVTAGVGRNAFPGPKLPEHRTAHGLPAGSCDLHHSSCIQPVRRWIKRYS